MVGFLNNSEFSGSSAAEFQDAVVKWLKETGISYSGSARIADRKGVKANLGSKADVMMAAATHIAQIKINPLPKSNKCPNCGEEML